jgi:hypothetical protein
MTAVAVDPALGDGVVPTRDKDKVDNRDPERAPDGSSKRRRRLLFPNSARAVATLIEFCVSKDDLSKQQESDHEYRRQ